MIKLWKSEKQEENHQLSGDKTKCSICSSRYHACGNNDSRLGGIKFADGILGYIGQTVKVMFPDSTIATHFQCARFKGTAITKEIAAKTFNLVD